jgi:hypothetical protein
MRHSAKVRMTENLPLLKTKNHKRNLDQKYAMQFKIFTLKGFLDWYILFAIYKIFTKVVAKKTVVRIHISESLAGSNSIFGNEIF